MSDWGLTHCRSNAGPLLFQSLEDGQDANWAIQSGKVAQALGQWSRPTANTVTAAEAVRQKISATP